MIAFSAVHRRRRNHLLFVSALILVFFVLHSYLKIAFAILIYGPFISTWRSDHLHLSQEKDGFDITFASYPAQPSAEVDRNLAVPPIMHNILLGSAYLNENLTTAREACLAMHPQYEFKFWTTTDADEFVAKEFPEMIHTWNSYRYLIQKADSLRYMVLYTYGGIFLDLDLECLRPLDPLRRFDFVAPAATPMGISNGFLMVSPRHPFLKSVIQNLPRYNINWFGLPYATVMFSTGCHFLSTMHALFPNRDDLRVLWGPKRLHRLSGVATTPLFHHLGLSSWHSFDGTFFSIFRSDHGLALFSRALTLVFFIGTITFAVLGWRKYRSTPHRTLLV